MTPYFAVDVSGYWLLQSGCVRCLVIPHVSCPVIGYATLGVSDNWLFHFGCAMNDCSTAGLSDD